MQQAVVAYKFSRWDDDVVFRNQARGTENKGKKEFVNVCSYGWQLTEHFTDHAFSGSTSLRFPQTLHGKKIA